MCSKVGRSTRCRSGLVLSSLVLSLGFFFLPCQGTSAQALPKQSPLWSSLKQTIDSFPTTIKLYNDSLTAQINSLQDNVKQLQSSKQNLLDSNSLLAKQNQDLLTSNTQLQAQVETSSKQLETLQAHLTSSLKFTTQAQRQAKALELQNKIMEWGLGIVLGAVGTYEGGRALHFW